MTGAIYVAGALDYETRKRVSTRERFPLMISMARGEISDGKWKIQMKILGKVQLETLKFAFDIESFFGIFPGFSIKTL
jgi:hypothetical protein